MKSKMRSAVAVLMLTLSVSSTGWAEAPNLSGFVETSYNLNFNRPPSQTQRGRSFDFHTNSFIFNAFHLKAVGSIGEDAGYVGELIAGSDARVIKDPFTQVAGAGTAGSGAASNVEYHEAYAWYKCPLMNGVTFTAGKFATLEGIEVIEGPDNYTVSRGFLFGLAEPFTHTGFKANYAFTDQFDLTLGLVNGWDTLTDNNRGKTIIGRVGLNLGDLFNGGISFTYGAEKDNLKTAATAASLAAQDDKRTSLDATFWSKFNDMVTVAWQANYGEEEKASAYTAGLGATWFGFGIQPKITVSDKFWVGARYEYFEDKDGARTAPAVAKPHALQNITIAPAWKIYDPLTFQVEGRYDWSSQSYFEQKDGAVANFNAAQQFTVGAKFDYVF